MYVLFTRVTPMHIWKLEVHRYVGHAIDSSEDNARFAFEPKDLDTLILFWIP